MYTHFRIQNFRGFKDLELKDLARVNLIGGKNNVGKTSLMEGIFAYNGNYQALLNRTPLSSPSSKRDAFTDLSAYKSIFNNFNTNDPIVISGNYIPGTRQPTLFPELDNRNFHYDVLSVSLKKLEMVTGDLISQYNNPDREILKDIFGLLLQGNDENILFLTGDNINRVSANQRSVFIQSYINILARDNTKRFSNLKRTRNLDLLIKPLRLIEPRLVDLDLLEGGIYADIGLSELIPLNSMGQGLGRILTIVLAITAAEDNIVIIDEIENGLHYTVQSDVWRALSEVAKLFNTQIFATTHSLEMIRAAQQAFADTGEDDFRYYRIDRHPETDEPLAVRYAPETIQAAVNMDFEVRG